MKDVVNVFLRRGLEAPREEDVARLAFVRIALDRRVYARPLTPAEACAIVESWLSHPNAQLLQPRAADLDPAKLTLRRRPGKKGPMVMDAHLAALALEHGATIATTDRDFARFPRLETVNPLDET